MNEVRLRVPARAEYLHLLRNLVASVSARRELSIDAIEDLSLAVHEAAAYLITKGSSQAVSLRIPYSEQTVEAVIWIDGGQGQWPPPSGPGDEFSRNVLEGLTDGVEFVWEGDSPAIRIVKSKIG